METLHKHQKILFRPDPGSFSTVTSRPIRPELRGTKLVTNEKSKITGDLQRQCEFMRERHPHHEVVTGIDSGTNFKRPGLLSILERARTAGISEVVVTNRDRLCRLAFDLVQWLLESYGTRVVVLDESASASADAELADDLLAITTVIVCRHHGRRSHRGQKRKREGESQEAQAEQDKERGREGTSGNAATESQEDSSVPI